MHSLTCHVSRIKALLFKDRNEKRMFPWFVGRVGRQKLQLPEQEWRSVRSHANAAVTQPPSSILFSMETHRAEKCRRPMYPP
jgi:hypothetical protein